MNLQERRSKKIILGGKNEFEEATPESGTGKYYKQSTYQALEVRKIKKIRKHGSVEAYNRKMNK